MKTIFSTAIVLLVFLTNTAIGQGYVFKVLANRGVNKVKTSAGETQPLKTGATLNAGDAIIASNGAYIGLMHKTGRTIEVRTAGVTQISDLEKKLAATKSGVANRYAQFVMNKMNQGDDDVNKNYRRNLKATGAVERATNNASIKLMLPGSSTKVFNSNFVIKWTGGEEGTNYVVTVGNVFGEELYTSETTNTSIKVNFDDENLANEELLTFTVRSKDNEELKSTEYGVQRVLAQAGKETSESLQALQSEVSDDSPLNKLIYASFYEENNHLLDALTKYEEAIELSPDVEDFKTLYNDFLIRNGFIK